MKAIIRKMNLSFLTYLEINPVILSEVRRAFSLVPPGDAPPRSRKISPFSPKRERMICESAVGQKISLEARLRASVIPDRLENEAHQYIFPLPPLLPKTCDYASLSVQPPHRES
ncbi:MAG TPA: hypothetical protein VGG55_02870 [Candidatus Acidoferrales bacterium]|jgi:hypothetical protein